MITSIEPPARIEVRCIPGEPLASDLYVTAAGYYPRAAWHSLHGRTLNEHVLVYCRAGTGWLSLAERKQPVTAGDIFICPSGLKHGYGSNKEQPWSILWLQFSGHDSQRVLTLLGCGAEATPLNIGQDEVMSVLLRSIVASYTEKDDVLAGLEANAILRQVISRWFALSRPAPRIPRQIQRVLRALREHYSKAHSVADLAQLSGWSAPYFARCFRRVMGSSPIEYLVRLRLKHASELLMTTREPVGAIAKQIGYDDAYYFSRLFRSVIGLSPREYRRTLGEASARTEGFALRSDC